MGGRRSETFDSDARLRELEAVAGLVGDAIISLDVSGNIVGWSEGARRLTGYTAEDVLGQGMSVLYTEEDRAAGLAQRELDSARDSGRFEDEGWRLRKGGQRFRSAVVVAPIRSDSGEVTGYVKLARDVTAQRADESMFRGLLESAPDAMLFVEPDGRIALVNRQVEQLFGYPRDELVGQRVMSQDMGDGSASGHR